MVFQLMKTSWRGLEPKDIVKKARIYSGLNQTLFGDEVKKSQEMISKYESGETPPPSTLIIHCMNILDEHDYGFMSKNEAVLQQEWQKLKELGDSLLARG